MAISVRFWIRSTLNSYSQVFFSTYAWFGIILLIMTFLEPPLGLSGLLIVLFTNAFALWFGFDKSLIERGDYGFNALLVGLGLGAYYDLNLPFLLVLVSSALIVLLVTILVSGILFKYGLPYLSIPFLLVFWLVLLAAGQFSALGLTERGVFLLNELYATGEVWLVNIYHTFNRLLIPESITIYIKSLGAIFFQFNIVSGILVLIGLVLYSRIAFLSSLISFYAAYGFYYFIGAEITDLSYSFIGFNFILTGIAIGAFFVIPSVASHIWIFLLVPAMVIITSSLGHLFAYINLGIYSLPFNMVVITFLYAMYMRKRKVAPHVVPYQWFSPEKNLYSWIADRKVYENMNLPAIGLPFFGKWTVSQGYDGNYTHKGPWNAALDFIILDENDNSYEGDGNMLSDYFCYGKPVVAPADGEVVYVENGIPDNVIGKSNINQNWGNTVVIQHSAGIFSQVSHLKYQSIGVKKGEFIQRGQQVGLCGNSGRSPYPHLHYQVQQTAEPGSPTLSYPVDHYIRIGTDSKEFIDLEIPKEGEIIAAAQPDPEKSDILTFQPDQNLNVEMNGKKFSWQAQVDEWNRSFISSRKARVYYRNDGRMFACTSYDGPLNDPLHIFFLALYRLPLTDQADFKMQTTVPLHLVDRSFLRSLADFIAPFMPVWSAVFRIDFSTDRTNQHIKTSLACRGKEQKNIVSLEKDLIRIENENDGELIIRKT